jgi:diguanylate cyclase (GGDEF)-like protein
MVERRYNVIVWRVRLARLLLWFLAAVLLVVSTIQLVLPLAGFTLMDVATYTVTGVFFGVLALLGWRLSSLRNFAQVSQVFAYGSLLFAFGIALNTVLWQAQRRDFNDITDIAVLMVWQLVLPALAAGLYGSRMVVWQALFVMALGFVSVAGHVGYYLLVVNGDMAAVPWGLFVNVLLVGGVSIGVLRGLVYDKERLFYELDDKHSALASQFDYSKHLINRRRLFEILEQEVAKAQYYQEPLSLVVVELDNSGAFSKKHGFAINHKTLNEASSRVQLQLRSTDTFGYWGEESFMVIAPGAEVEPARRLAHRLERGLAAHTIPPLGQVEAYVAVSSHHPGDTVANLLARLKLNSRDNGYAAAFVANTKATMSNNGAGTNKTTTEKAGGKPHTQDTIVE